MKQKNARLPADAPVEMIRKSKADRKPLFCLVLALACAAALLLSACGAGINAPAATPVPTPTPEPTPSPTPEPKIWTVILDKQGGTGGTASVRAEEGEDMPGADSPMLTDYTFCGYYSEPEGAGVQYYDAEMRSMHVCDFSGDATLYAYWVYDYYEIILDPAEGTGGTESIVLKQGERMPKAEAPSREGYCFCGYYSEPEGGGTQYYDAGMKSAARWEDKNDTTLYACWVFNTVTLDRREGNWGTQFVYPAVGADMPKAEAPNRNGYVFCGYYTEPEGDGTQYYDYMMNSVHAWDDADVLTLYASWAAPETEYSPDLTMEEPVFADIDKVGISSAMTNVYIIYSQDVFNGVALPGVYDIAAYVCRCRNTNSGTSVWVYFNMTDYLHFVDPHAVTTATTGGFLIYNGVSLKEEKRLNGTLREADSLMEGLSEKIGEYVIVFSSFD